MKPRQTPAASLVQTLYEGIEFYRLAVHMTESTVLKKVFTGMIKIRELSLTHISPYTSIQPRYSVRAQTTGLKFVEVEEHLADTMEHVIGNTRNHYLKTTLEDLKPLVLENLEHSQTEDHAMAA